MLRTLLVLAAPFYAYTYLFAGSAILSELREIIPAYEAGIVLTTTQIAAVKEAGAYFAKMDTGNSEELNLAADVVRYLHELQEPTAMPVATYVYRNLMELGTEPLAEATVAHVLGDLWYRLARKGQETGSGDAEVRKHFRYARVYILEARRLCKRELAKTPAASPFTVLLATINHDLSVVKAELECLKKI